MRRGIRWTVTIASGILLVSALAAWTRSYWVSDRITIALPRVTSQSASTLHFAYGNGGLFAYYVTRSMPAVQSSKAITLTSQPPFDAHRVLERSLLGFGIASYEIRSRGGNEITP